MDTSNWVIAQEQTPTWYTEMYCRADQCTLKNIDTLAKKWQIKIAHIQEHNIRTVLFKKDSLGKVVSYKKYDNTPFYDYIALKKGPKWTALWRKELDELNRLACD
jgi:hypothetical protein